jgi:hypothetical protein
MSADEAIGEIVLDCAGKPGSRYTELLETKALKITAKLSVEPKEDRDRVK